MTRFVIDAPAAVRLVREGATVAGGHQLVAPSVLRSQVLSLVYRQTRQGALTPAEARTVLDGITAMKVRLLGDRVSRAVAWKVAEQLGWEDTVTAEYVAVARLQADAFVTLDEDLAREVGDLIPVAPFEALLKA